MTYSSWYQRKKEEIAASRKKRYANDPEYRRKAKESAKLSRRPRPRAPLPPGYAYSLPEAAAVLGVSSPTIREWLRKGYLPTPKKYRGRFVFSSPQIDLMERLRVFMATKASKTSVHSSEFHNLKSYILVNWK